MTAEEPTPPPYINGTTPPSAAAELSAPEPVVATPARHTAAIRPAASRSTATLIADPSALKGQIEAQRRAAELAKLVDARRTEYLKKLEADEKEATRLRESPFPVADAKIAVMLAAKSWRTEARVRFDSLLEHIGLPSSIAGMKSRYDTTPSGHNSLQPLKAWIEYFESDDYMGDGHSQTPTSYMIAKKNVGQFDAIVQQAKAGFLDAPQEPEDVTRDRALVAERDGMLKDLTTKAHKAIIDSSSIADEEAQAILDRYAQSVADAERLFDFALTDIKPRPPKGMMGSVFNKDTEPMTNVNFLRQQVEAALSTASDKDAAALTLARINHATEKLAIWHTSTREIKAQHPRLDDGRTDPTQQLPATTWVDAAAADAGTGSVVRRA